MFNKARKTQLKATASILHTLQKKKALNNANLLINIPVFLVQNRAKKVNFARNWRHILRFLA